MENPASAIPASSSLWGSLNSWFTSTVFFILLNLMIATILFTSNLPNQQQQENNQEQQDQEDKKQKQDSDNHPQIARSPSILHRLKSFNFLPQQQLQTQDDDDDDNQLEREPLHVAATQYVFNQPLHYQHFDFDSDHTHQVERVDDEFHFDPTRDEMGKVEDGENFDFEPTRKENGIDGLDESFDFEPTRKENEYERFDFDPTRKEDAYERFEVDPTHEDEQADQLQSLDEVYSKLKGGGHHDRTKSESEIRPKPTTKFKKSASLKVGFSHLNQEKTVEARRPATVRERKPAAKEVHDDDVEVDSKADDFINKFKNDLKLQRIESIMKSKSGKK